MSAAEAWKPIAGYVGLYEISDQGRVRRVSGGKGAKIGRILSQNTNGQRNQGHLWVDLYRDGLGVKFYVHRLVAAAFVPGSGPIVRHLDSDPSNNVPSNLAWGTAKDNAQDMLKAGRGGTNGMERRTHCNHGHEFSTPNTRIARNGSRVCRACESIRVKAKYWLNKQKAAA